MKPIMEEINSKVKRIRELSNMGFNTPRMLFFPAGSKVSFSKLISFLNNNKHRQKFGNIRTYVRENNKESFNSKHLTYVKYNKIYEEVVSLTKNNVNCIVDLEWPGDGILAGSVLLNKNKSFIVDYCHKPEGGAMVRMADDPQYGITTMGVMGLLNQNFDDRLVDIIKMMFNNFTKPYDHVIVEFCWMKNKCGVLNDHKIFWEYRNLVRF